jgi:hypothetical protein
MIPALFAEDLHGGDGANVWLTCSALGRSTLEDSGADDVAATRLGAIS